MLVNPIYKAGDVSTVDFSISYIAGQQEGLYKKYKEEKKKLFEKG